MQLRFDASLRVSGLVIALVSFVLVGTAGAVWHPDGNAVVTAQNDQFGAHAVSDGAGGAIVVWADKRANPDPNLGGDIYAQRIDAAGNVLWTVDGEQLGAAWGGAPAVASDGSGGAFVTWEGSDGTLRAARIHASGHVLWQEGPGWSPAPTVSSPDVVGDGSGGAFVVWEDSRNIEVSYWDIYADWLDGRGHSRWHPWELDGKALCTATGWQGTPTVAGDGSGGAIVAWQDNRTNEGDIYAQRIDASGHVVWTTDGIPVCTAGGYQSDPRIVCDGFGGAIIVWIDGRSGYPGIYAQRIDSTGAAVWLPIGGKRVSEALLYQQYPELVSDGSGGAIVTWLNKWVAPHKVYAQRINAKGISVWALGGIEVCPGERELLYARPLADGSGGAIVAWSEKRADGYDDVYAQRLDAAGNRLWDAGGVVVCSAADDQYGPRLVEGPKGGAIVVWGDNREGWQNPDVYAQMIDAQGRAGYTPPVIQSVRDVPGDQGGRMYVSWYPSLLDEYHDPDMNHYTVWRALPAAQARVALRDGATLVESPAIVPQGGAGRIIRTEQRAGTTYFWELMAYVDAYGLSGYGVTVPTLYDSTTTSNPYHYVQVIAHTTTPSLYFASDPDSGYSVDNLAPAMPGSLTGYPMVGPPGLTLQWAPNGEADFSHYAIYRDSTADFTPGAGNRLATTSATSYVDMQWRWDRGYHYKVSAIDIHGNESDFAYLGPGLVTGVGDSPSAAGTWLAQNVPNPFNPYTTLRFGLKDGARVTLAVYDVSGRRVRVLVDGWKPAGAHAVRWDGRDDAGNAVASGVYFARLTSGGITQVRSMVLLK